MNGPVRVLFVVPDLRIGGAERHVTTLAPRMDSRRFEPAIVCIGQEGKLFGTLVAAGVPAIALHCTKRQAGRALWLLIGQMHRWRPDVVIVRGYSAEVLGRVAARLTGVPCVVMWVHNIGDIPPRGRVRAWTDRVLGRWTDRYFGVAAAQLPYLVADLRYPPERIRIIHNGVDVPSFAATSDRTAATELGVDASAPVVGTLAALRPEKDHVTLLRAARLVVDRIPATVFLIVGDGPMRPRLEQLTTDLGLGPNVRFTGSRDDVARVLRAIDVFVLSSATVECLPIALLEAMAAGRPAVCTSVGGVPELVADGRTGHLVPTRDPEALAGQVVSLLTDPLTAKRMGGAARARAESLFGLDRSVAQTEQAIAELVAESGRGGG
ncbi:Putative glycosyltransferase (fragment) [Rhodococcus sp. RD6.2]|uniref:glycosyltransferase n=1 Tax=Rhodococcus sp. RD6.2 TaxID=260936 RepID=UPI00063B115F